MGNTAWFDEELSRFERLSVGLVAEGISLVKIMPDGIAAREDDSFASVFPWSEARWSVLNRWRIAGLAGALAEAKVDVLHALDGRMWSGTILLATRLGLPAVLTSCSPLDIPWARRLARGQAIGTGVGRRVMAWSRAKSLAAAGHAEDSLPIGDREPPFIAASTLPLYRAMIGADDPEVLADEGADDMSAEPMATNPRDTAPRAIRCLPPGVHVADAPRAAPRGPGSSVCFAVTIDGRLDADTDALLRAIVRTIRRFPQAQFFIDAMREDQPAVYQRCTRLGLLANVSMAPRQLGNRDLLLRADALLQPQTLGRPRGLLLEAMGRGIPVIARHDPWLDMLRDRETAWIIDGPDENAWADALERAIAAPQRAAELAAAAWGWVKANRALSAEVEATIDLYREATGVAMTFDEALAVVKD